MRLFYTYWYYTKWYYTQRYKNNLTYKQIYAQLKRKERESEGGGGY